MKIPLGDTLVLLLYLLPGFLAMQIYRARYPAKPLSRFEAAGWSILHSFIILLGLATAAYYMPGCKALDILNLDTGSKIRPVTIVVLLSGGAIWGGILIAWHRLRLQLAFFPTPDPQAIWHVVVDNAPKEDLWVLARTRQGVLYLG